MNDCQECKDKDRKLLIAIKVIDRLCGQLEAIRDIDGLKGLDGWIEIAKKAWTDIGGEEE